MAVKGLVEIWTSVYSNQIRWLLVTNTESIWHSTEYVKLYQLCSTFQFASKSQIFHTRSRQCMYQYAIVWHMYELLWRGKKRTISHKPNRIIYNLLSITNIRFSVFNWKNEKNTVLPKFHYNDAIMGAIASQITSLTIVYSRWRSKKTPKPRATGLCAGNSPVTGEFPAQRASNAENVPIWWRHHVL